MGRRLRGREGIEWGGVEEGGPLRRERTFEEGEGL